MSKYTPGGRLKAKHNPAYRDPKFFGGLCCVCKKRPRNYQHEHYPHMCNKCRESRVFSHELPFTDPQVATEIKTYDMRVHGGHVPGISVQTAQTAEQLRIQTLNAIRRTPGAGSSLDEQIKAAAERFRNTLKK